MSVAHSTRYKNKTCSRCGEEGHKFRGDRWLCVIHNRMDTMRNCARNKGKYVPSWEELEDLIKVHDELGKTCSHCKKPTVWFGKRGQHDVITLQHDRNGKIRLLCFLCNQRHDDFPGDTFYDCPLDSKLCPACEQVKKLTDFPDWKGGCLRWCYCSSCQKEKSRISWSKYSSKKGKNACD